MDSDARVGGDAGGYAGGELGAIDSQGVAGRDGGGVGILEKKTSGAAHLLLEQPGSGVFGFGLEGVGTDELGEVGGLVGLGGALRPHLVELDLAAGRGRLQGGLRAGEAAADNFDFFHEGWFRVRRWPARPPPMTLIFFILL